MLEKVYEAIVFYGKLLVHRFIYIYIYMMHRERESLLLNIMKKIGLTCTVSYINMWTYKYVNIEWHVLHNIEVAGVSFHRMIFFFDQIS